MRLSSNAVLVGVLLAFASCALERPPEKRAINSYLADARDLACVRRIMVLPFSEEPGVVADKTRIRETYINELLKLRRFEVVPLPADSVEVVPLDASLRHGRISTDEIVALCNRYRLDGVLLGTITSCRAYTPPHLGMRTQLVSVHSGSIIWAVDVLYDASDRSMQSDLRHYYDRVLTHDGNLHGFEFDTIAPTRFCAYVAHRFVGTWEED